MSVNGNSIRQVCVYCASSRECEEAYFAAAETLGRELARKGITIIYGGGAGGLMGRLADAALSQGGRIIGILPRFMEELEWGHQKLTELVLVNDMHERKRAMLERADAVVALPGGCGTLEELFEAITWKRLGLFFGPVVLVNVNRFFDPCLQLLSSCVSEGFLDEKHAAMWSVAEEPESVAAALESAPPWPRTARSFAAIR